MANIQKEISCCLILKHDIESNWNRATTFIPKQGELIIYDRDTNYFYERFKIGDGITTVAELPFVNENIVLPANRVLYGETSVADILAEYIFNIDYNSMLAFDTSEIILNESSSTSAILGQAILGQMVLA